MKKLFEIATICKHKNECWFFARRFNGLFYKNIESGYSKDCGKVPWESTNTEYLYRDMQLSNNKIYLIPYQARSIAIYDINTGKFKKLSIDSQIMSGKRNLFRAGLVKDGVVFAFGVHAEVIIAIDTFKDSIDYYTKWFDEVSPYIRNRKGAFFRKQLVVVNDVVYLPLVYADIILTMDLKSREVNLLNIGLGTSGYVGIAVDRNKLFLSERSGTGLIGCVDFVAKEKCKITDLWLEGSEEAKYLIIENGNLTVLPLNKVEKESLNGIEIRKGSYECILCNGEQSAFFNDEEGNILFFDKGCESIIDISVNLSKEECALYEMNNSILVEKNWYGLTELIEDLSGSK